MGLWILGTAMSRPSTCLPIFQCFEYPGHHLHPACCDLDHQREHMQRLLFFVIHAYSNAYRQNAAVLKAVQQNAVLLSTALVKHYTVKDCHQPGVVLIITRSTRNVDRSTILQKHFTTEPHYCTRIV